MVQTLIAKFGAFWPPFDAHLRASGVPLHEMDSDTDWARLLEEVEWPTGLCPNVAQQSALKFALRAFCSRRDAELESSSGDGGAAKIGRTSRRVLESFLPPVLGTNEEQDSRKPPAPTPLLRVPNRRILIGHQGLIPGRPEDEHTARLLEDCLRGRPASATVSFGSSRPLLRALPRTAPPWTGAKPGNPPEVDLHRLADTLLDWEPTGARTLAPIRLFPSTPSDNDDASRLADALLKENGSTPGATPLAVARAVKGVAITAETCPAILNATEQALDRLTKSEFHAFKDATPTHPAGHSVTLVRFPPVARRRPPPPRATLALRTADLHAACGLDRGSVVNHWLKDWRTRGRPNGTDELEAAEAATRQLLSNTRQRPLLVNGRPSTTPAVGSTGNRVRYNITDGVNTEEPPGADATQPPGEDPRCQQATAGLQTANQWRLADGGVVGEFDFQDMMLWLDKAATELAAERNAET